MPVTVEVGNHDMPYFNPVERFFAPYKRFKGMERVVERELSLPDLSLIPLKTAVRAQPRFNWSKGWVTDGALKKCLAAIDALPPGCRALVAVHHPLREVGTEGTALTKHGERALAELAHAAGRGGAERPCSRRVRHRTEATPNGPVRMIGAGMLSQRVRSTPPSFNQIVWNGESLSVDVRTLDERPNEELRIDDVPPDAMPPRRTGGAGRANRPCPGGRPAGALEVRRR